jgi:dienelactone hydrolase
MPPEATSTVRFELGDGPLAFGDVPFPSDLYRDAEGRVSLGAWPNPHDGGAMFEALRELLATRDGFCTTCNVTFAIEGGLDPASLPDARTLTEADAGERIALVDIDADSPERGRRVPLRAQWDQERGLLSVRPLRGVVLRPHTRYAAVLTDALRGEDGTPLAPSADFVALRDDAESDPSPRLERARAVLEPALSTLGELGWPRRHVVGLSSFTTEDPTRELLSMRASIRASAPPVARVERIVTGEALDDLLGVPATPGPGIDLLPAEGTEGTRAIAHETTALVVVGRFSAPRFVEGTGTDVGAITRDDQGLPVAESSDDVPFLLIVPRGVDLAHLPVVVSHHGFNASRTTGFVLADTAGRAGYAVLAIDAYQHGERAASARDELHAMRGELEGADGFSEASQLEVSGRVFGLTGGAEGMTLFPGYPLAAFEQFAADALSTVRFVREGELDELRAADPSLGELTFDAERIVFVGNSMGAVVGTSVVAAEPDVRAAVLDVLPGSIVETLCESGEFRPLATGLLLPQVGVSGSFDEHERAMVFDPTVDLIRWVLEPIDPLALAPFLVRQRREAAGDVPDLLVQLAGHDEVAAPTASESVVSASGIPGDGDFRFAPVAVTELPVRGAEASYAAVRFDGAMHGMLEMHEQASKYEDPLTPPLAQRPDQAIVVNPIEQVHGQIEVFLKTFLEDGRASIVR